MINDLKYTVRSREIVDLVQAMKSQRLTLSPYFQRNLVWRDAHKRDFIDTILKGYPFPQIFLARGPIDLDTMTASQAVVDGQQRLNTILDFVNGKLKIDGKTFRDFADKVRSEFLKYEIAVIDFDLDVGDSRLKDVFHRLNRTYYSLSAIEKLSSEYSASEFMLVARVLCGDIVRNVPDEDKDFLLDVDDDGQPAEKIDNLFSKDPGIDDETWAWMQSQADGPFATLIRRHSIFSSFEFDRKIPLMFVLNLMCTMIAGYYNRNDKVRALLEDNVSAFPEKEEVIYSLNDTADYIEELDFPESAIWWNKANFFSLATELSRLPSLKEKAPWLVADSLMKFADSMPREYALAAREAVNGKLQRELRGSAIRDLILSVDYPSS